MNENAMSSEARELAAFIENTKDGLAMLLSRLESYFEWGGGFQPDEFRVLLREGVSAAANRYPDEHGSDDLDSIFSSGDIASVVSSLEDLMKSDFSLSESGRALFFYCQTNSPSFLDAMSPMVERLKQAQSESRAPVDGLAVRERFITLVNDQLPAFRQHMIDEECEALITEADAKMVARELTDFYLVAHDIGYTIDHDVQAERLFQEMESTYRDMEEEARSGKGMTPSP